MDYKNKQIERYLKIIDEIEKIRTNNNVNWMFCASQLSMRRMRLKSS